MKCFPCLFVVCLVFGAISLSSCSKPKSDSPASKESQTPVNLAALQEKLRALEAGAPTQAWEVDASGVTKDSGYGILSAFPDGKEGIVKVTNVFTTEDGGKVTTTCYFDKKSELVASTEQSALPGQGGVQHFSEEIKFYGSGALMATISRRGEFSKNAKIDPSTLESFLTPATEMDENGAVEAYEYMSMRAIHIGTIVRAFRNRAGVLPPRILLDTMSPDGRYVIQWEPVKAAGKESENATFSLFDIQKDKVVGSLNGTLPPGSNQIYHWAFWSKNAAWLLFAEDGKWTTRTATLYRMNPDGPSVAGSIFESATAAVWNHLKSSGHPYARQGEGIHGYVRVVSLENNGFIDMVLATESKSEEPGATLGTQMELRPVDGKGLEASKVRVLPDPEQESAGDAALSIKPIFISNEAVGPITSGAPFALTALSKLFTEQCPGYEVVEGTDTFEEGDEQPVFRVQAGEETLLTIAPVVGQRKLGFVFTRSPQVATTSGFAPGTSFGEIFKSLPNDANFEGMTGDVTVPSPGMPNVLFRFAPEDRSESEGISELPPVGKLNAWKLDTIEWRPVTQ